MGDGETVGITLGRPFRISMHGTKYCLLWDLHAVAHDNSDTLQRNQSLEK